MSLIKATRQHDRRRFLGKQSWARLAPIAFSLLISVLASGCREDPVIWSTQTRSLDGNWIAYAHTVQHNGMGTDGVETIVELKRQTSPKASIRVLGFANDGSSMGLKMNWVTPSRLDVSFKDDPKVLYYQVIKTSGIEIFVQNLGDPQGSLR